MSYTECVKTLTSMPIWTYSDIYKAQTKCPQVDAYNEKLLTQPQPHWHRCDNTTIQEYKPSPDCQTPWLEVSLIIFGFALIFFNASAEPDQERTGGSNWASTTTSINLSPGIETSRIFSRSLVLLVIIQLIVASWDRIAYLSRSIFYKLILHYVYAAIPLLFAWLLVPYHTRLYFNKRVYPYILYLVHIMFLWLVGLQILHGYRVYRGLRYKSSDEDSF